jgi:hypothetical protein
VAGDVNSPRDPRAALVCYMPHYPVERADLTRLADYAQVQADRHHLQLVRAFAVEPIEGVDDELSKIAGAAEALV